MFGLKLPVMAAAGAVAVLAVSGVTGLPKQAVADEGGGGTGSSASSSPSSGASGSSEAGASSDSEAGLSSGSSADSSSSSSAGTGSGMDVSPRTVSPGGVVSLRLTTSCKAGKTATASADVFVDTVTLSAAGDGHGMEGNAFIRSDAVEGSYAISVQCSGGSASASASITVSSSSGSGNGNLPVSPVQPVNPVPAGGGAEAHRVAARGGAEQLAAGPAAAGTSTGPLLATGGVAAAGLVGLVAYRRRSTARG
jgi:hypothetical protein